MNRLIDGRGDAIDANLGEIVEKIIASDKPHRERAARIIAAVAAFGSEQQAEGTWREWARREADSRREMQALLLDLRAAAEKLIVAWYEAGPDDPSTDLAVVELEQAVQNTYTGKPV